MKKRDKIMNASWWSSIVFVLFFAFWLYATFISTVVRLSFLIGYKVSQERWVWSALLRCLGCGSLMRWSAVFSLSLYYGLRMYCVISLYGVSLPVPKVVCRYRSHDKANEKPAIFDLSIAARAFHKPSFMTNTSGVYIMLPFTCVRSMDQAVDTLCGCAFCDLICHKRIIFTDYVRFGQSSYGTFLV